MRLKLKRIIIVAILLCALAATATAHARTSSLFGATVNRAGHGPCVGGQVNICEARKFDSYVHLKMAMARQKVDLRPGEIPSSVPSAWTRYVHTGGQLLISLKPSVQTSHRKDRAFTTFVRKLRRTLGRSWKVVLWAEPNTGKSAAEGMRGPSKYRAFARHYTPLFRRAAPGISVVYDPALCGTENSCNAPSDIAFYPRGTRPNAISVDYYGSAWLHGGRLFRIARLARKHRLPIGLGEWGREAGPTKFSLAKWNTYVAYLQSFFVTRRRAGKPIGWLILWASAKKDSIRSARDRKIPAIRRFNRAMSR